VSIEGRITIKQIAAFLAVSKATVYEMLKQHVIPSVRVGHRYIVTLHAFDAWEKTCGKEVDVANGEHKLAA
jgi:excisionase family DNA binding protein